MTQNLEYKTTLDVYIDGACSGNPGSGGWGVYIIYQGEEISFYGSDIDTTNNKMELTAAIEALKYINDVMILNHQLVKKNMKINIFTDSKYLQQGITDWIYKWEKNNWQASNKKPVKNVSLWQSIKFYDEDFDINWSWVKGHGVNAGNIFADSLAVKGRDNAKEMLRDNS